MALGELDLPANQSELGAQPGLEGVARGRILCCHTRRRSCGARKPLSEKKPGTCLIEKRQEMAVSMFGADRHVPEELTLFEFKLLSQLL